MNNTIKSMVNFADTGSNRQVGFSQQKTRKVNVHLMREVIVSMSLILNVVIIILLW